MKKIRFEYDESLFNLIQVDDCRYEVLTDMWVTCGWENTLRSMYVSFLGGGLYKQGFYLRSGWYPFVKTDGKVYGTCEEAYCALEEAVSDWINEIELSIQKDRNIPDDAKVVVAICVGEGRDGYRDLLKNDSLKRLNICDLSSDIYDPILQSFPDIFEDLPNFVRNGREELCDDYLYCKAMESIVFPRLPIFNRFSEDLLFSIVRCSPARNLSKAEVYQLTGQCTTEEDWWNLLKDDIGYKQELLLCYLAEGKEKAKKFIDWVY